MWKITLHIGQSEEEDEDDFTARTIYGMERVLYKVIARYILALGQSDPKNPTSKELFEEYQEITDECADFLLLLSSHVHNRTFMQEQMAMQQWYETLRDGGEDVTENDDAVRLFSLAERFDAISQECLGMTLNQSDGILTAEERREAEDAAEDAWRQEQAADIEARRQEMEDAKKRKRDR